MNLLPIALTLAVLAPTPVGAVVGYTRFAGKARQPPLLLLAIAMLTAGVAALWLSMGADRYAGGHSLEVKLTFTGLVIGGLGLGALGAWLALVLGLFGRVVAGVLAFVAIVLGAVYALALALHVSGFA